MSVRRNLAWVTAAQGSFFCLQFLSSVVVARLLTPYDIGVYAVALAITGVLGIIQAFGLNGFIVREHDLDRDLISTIFTINACIGLVLSASIAALSTLGGGFLQEAGVERVMLVLAIMPFLGIFEFLPAAILERNAQFKTLSLINTARTLISTVLTVVLALDGFSYMSMVFGQLAAASFSVIAYNIVGRQHASLRVRLTNWRRIGGFGVQMLAIYGVNALATRTMELLLARLLGLSALGLYARATNLNNLLWENIHVVIMRVMLVDLAKQRREGLSLRNRYLKIVEILTAFLWPGFAGLALLAQPFIYNVYGPKWLAAAHPFVMLAVSSMVLVAITMAWEIFIVCQQTAQQARLEFIRTGTGVVLFAAGCLVSLTAAATARIGDAMILTYLYRPHLNRMTGTRTSDFLPIYRRSLALTIVAITPSALLMVAYRGSELTPLGYVFAAIGLGIIAWLGALKVTAHPIFEEFYRVVASRKRSPT